MLTIIILLLLAIGTGFLSFSGILAASALVLFVKILFFVFLISLVVSLIRTFIIGVEPDEYPHNRP